MAYVSDLHLIVNNKIELNRKSILFDYAKKWCKINNRTIISILGFGDDGIAFEINYNQVLKITLSFNEAVYAEKAIKDKPQGIIQYKSSEFLTEHHFAIVMDKVDAINARQCFSDIENKYHFIFKEKIPLEYIEIEKILKYLNEKETSFIKQIHQTIQAHQYTDFLIDDLHSGNVGFDKDNNVVVFDQKNDHTQAFLYMIDNPTF